MKKIIYVYDALCGWCYGFSPVMKQFFEKYKQEFTFDVLSGGMVLGERAGEIGKVAPYISWAYKNVEEATGVKFGENFLENVLKPGTAIFSSEKSGIAMTVFKHFQPHKAVYFAHDLQDAVYNLGLDLNSYEAYKPIIEKYHIKSDIFIRQMQDAETKERTFDEFALVSEMGINGFPTLIYANGSEGILLSRGYLSLEKLEDNLQKVQAEFSS
ncbi:MAG: DsbA family protein [Verrucomicrobia bacterium]|nr:DsbA family protein [Cytophagales bacterium]